MAAFAASAVSAALAAVSSFAALPADFIAQNSDAPNVNTATSTSAVYAAQATAATYEGSTPYVGGAAFDRFITIWLENTGMLTCGRIAP